MSDQLVLVVSRRPQFLATWVFLQSCLSGLTTWQLASPRVIIQEREKDESHNFFYELNSEVIYHHIHSIPGLTEVSLFSTGGDSPWV